MVTAVTFIRARYENGLRCYRSPTDTITRCYDSIDTVQRKVINNRLRKLLLVQRRASESLQSLQLVSKANLTLTTNLKP